MTKLRGTAVLLITTVAAVGCVPSSNVKRLDANAPATKETSCAVKNVTTERSKSRMVELAWCIAETDELYDPKNLFIKTLGISDYRISEGITWGVQATARGHGNVDHLPHGILGFLFQRRDPKELNDSGRRRFGFGVDTKNMCVKQEDIFATFGREFWISPAPIRVPGSTLLENTPTSSSKKTAVYGIYFKSPRLFMGDSSGIVSFDFDYGECANYIRIQRDLDFITHQQKENRK